MTISATAEITDEFTEAMWQHMIKVSEMCAAKVKELRKENARLHRIIAEFPATCYELQERATMLETQLVAAKGTP